MTTAEPSAHPITATAPARLREVLVDAFAAAAQALGGGTAPAPAVSTGRVDLPPSDPRVPGTGGVETSTTRTAATDDGRLVLHETTTLADDATEVRMTIALTGSSVEGHRFWLGATSYDAAPVDHLELLGDLPAFVAPVLGQVLIALRQG